MWEQFLVRTVKSDLFMLFFTMSISRFKKYYVSITTYSLEMIKVSCGNDFFTFSLHFLVDVLFVNA